MKVLFLTLVILLLVMDFKKEKKVLKEPFENPDERIFETCGNSYIVEDNIIHEPLNGLYTEILKMKYKDLGGLQNKVPICYEEVHPDNDKKEYDYFNGILEDPMDLYSKPNETDKPILYGFDVEIIK